MDNLKKKKERDVFRCYHRSCRINLPIPMVQCFVESCDCALHVSCYNFFVLEPNKLCHYDPTNKFNTGQVACTKLHWSKSKKSTTPLGIQMNLTSLGIKITTIPRVKLFLVNLFLLIGYRTLGTIISIGVTVMGRPK